MGAGEGFWATRCGARAAPGAFASDSFFLSSFFGAASEVIGVRLTDAANMSLRRVEVIFISESASACHFKPASH